MKAHTITTPQTVDQVCRRLFGDESGFVEAVLDRNPGLAAAEVLPTGTVVTLPPDDVLPRPDVPVVTLWS